MVKVWWNGKCTNVPIAYIRENGMGVMLKAAVPDYQKVIAKKDHAGFYVFYSDFELNEQQLKELTDDDAVQIFGKLKETKINNFAKSYRGSSFYRTPQLFSKIVELPPRQLQGMLGQMNMLSLESTSSASSTDGNDADAEMSEGEEEQPRNAKKKPQAELKYAKEMAILEGFGFANPVITQQVLVKTDGDVRKAMRLLIRAGN